jgi:glyceraldehyde-3-phosphate dehydrogenase/erythrose-4-phosphate dehydrogenase
LLQRPRKEETNMFCSLLFRYDNEVGYSNRIVELIYYIAKVDTDGTPVDTVDQVER